MFQIFDLLYNRVDIDLLNYFDMLYSTNYHLFLQLIDKYWHVYLAFHLANIHNHHYLLIMYQVYANDSDQRPIVSN
jgi:hypothetical protein